MKNSWLQKTLAALDALRARLLTRESLPDAKASQNRRSMEDIVSRMLTKELRPKRSSENRFPEQAPPEVHDELKRKLLALEDAAAESPDPQHFLRAALLDYTEVWQVTETIDDFVWANPDDEQVAIMMNCLLGQRFDYANSPFAYWVGKLGSKALHSYLEANYPDSLMSAWWDAYVRDVCQRVMWLRYVFYALPLVGISAPGRRNILPDDVILDQWTARMAAARSKALESPEEFGRGHQRLVGIWD
ncbi:MAG: hypothetical protein A2Z64_09655 [Betaproteobacteria bacterium RIFCSPLOWO2_02_67_12]|nr:MAG: hypothetical protein A2Z64_09655 [Betaproteobacteria bacterium RIFCSPLOWO2_02_67_12]